MTETIDAVVAGHLCLDITPNIFESDRSVSELFRPGTLIEVGKATTATGGTVSNTGLPLRRLGATVQLMGKVGDDVFGKAVIDLIKAEAPGAERGMSLVAGEKTSYTLVLAPPGVDRIFLHCPGSNDTFGAENLNLDVIAKARLLHFGYPPLMARMYGNEGAELKKIMELVKATGATTSMDMAYPDPTSPAGQANWEAILNKTLPYVDIFTPSVEELTLMLQREKYDQLVAKTGDGELLEHIDGELLSDLGDRCIEAGAAIVLIKCGYLGLYLRTAGLDRLEKLGRAKPTDLSDWANRELLEPSYTVEKILTAAGAGDCAIAGFLAAYLKDQSVTDTLHCSVAVGGQNLSAYDTVSGIKSWEQTIEQISARPAKNEVAIPLAGWKYDDQADHYVGPRDRCE